MSGSNRSWSLIWGLIATRVAYRWK